MPMFIYMPLDICLYIYANVSLHAIGYMVVNIRRKNYIYIYYGIYIYVYLYAKRKKVNSFGIYICRLLLAWRGVS